MATYAVDTDGVSGSYSNLNAAIAALPTPFTSDNTMTLAASTSVKDTTDASGILLNTTDSYRLYITGDDDYIYSPPDANKLSFQHSFGYYNHITIDGVQFEKPSMSGSYQPILEFNFIRDGIIIVKNSSFISAATVGQRERLISCDIGAAYNSTLTLANNYLRTKGAIEHLASACFYHNTSRPAYIYNNTFVGYKANYIDSSGAIYKNNIIDTSVAGSAVNASSDYNMFSGAFDMGGTNDEQSKTFTFTDLSSDDVHLDSADTGATGLATNLSSDPFFPFDYDGDEETRTDPWSAGKFKAPASGGVELVGDLQPIFTSAGQLEQSQTIVGSLEPVFTSAGQIVQVTGVELVGNLQPVFSSGGQVTQAQELTGDMQPVFTTDGQVLVNAELVGDMNPIFTTGGRIVVDGEIDLDNALILGTYTPEDRLNLASYTPTDKLILGTYTR